MTQSNPTLIRVFIRAKTQAQWATYLGWLAIVCFCVFGTLASMASFAGSYTIYWLFHYLPYVLVGISVPFSLYHLFLMYRYRIIQANILVIMLSFGLLLPLVAAIKYPSDPKQAAMALFLAVIAWFAMPYLLKVNITRFLNFLQKAPHKERR